jgi:hypothetical protein
MSIISEIDEILEKWRIRKFNKEDYERIITEITVRFKDNPKEAYNIFAMIFSLKEIREYIDKEIELLESMRGQS